jgi:hypothetical protein
LIWFLVLNATFSYIMATSFSGGRNRSTLREPPTMGKQLVNCITWLRIECTSICNLQNQARTHAVLVIGLYELLGGCHDIAEILLKVALSNTNQNQIKSKVHYTIISFIWGEHRKWLFLRGLTTWGLPHMKALTVFTLLDKMVTNNKYYNTVRNVLLYKCNKTICVSWNICWQSGFFSPVP